MLTLSKLIHVYTHLPNMFDHTALQDSNKRGHIYYSLYRSCP